MSEQQGFSNALDWKANGGYTALMEACRIGDHAICWQLIQLEADPFIKNEQIMEDPNTGETRQQDCEDIARMYLSVDTERGQNVFNLIREYKIIWINL